LYDTADPYTRRVVDDRRQLAGIVMGSPAIDAAGVVGQVTRVYPLVSEVTLLTDRQQSIPVINARTGSRHLANGNPLASGGSLELKFVPSGTDMQKGDLLTTSGIDGVYPPGLHVGRISQIDRRVDASFATVLAEPTAIERGRHLLVLLPFKDWPARPVADPTPNTQPKNKAAAKAPQGTSTAGGKP
jgi:rod shape-determining protein MreC